MVGIFKLKIKYYGETIASQKGESMEDFDELVEGLKKKFGGKKTSQ